MRMSQHFGQTLRNAPAEADTEGYRLLLRAGFIRQLAAGIFSYLPLARRSLTKIENIIRQAMNDIGGQEVTMPVVHPGDLWRETGRWYTIGDELTRFQDRNERDMVLAMTHEEVVADLVRHEISSYRQLPRLIYHIQTKWRDEPRPRAGLIRVREFTMKDSYSLDQDEEGLDKQYRAHFQAYFDIFHRCGLPVIAVRSDVGMMGGSMAHEFVYLNEIGEDTLFICDNCGYAANREVATFNRPEAIDEPPQPLEKVATPNTPTIEALAQFLDIPKSKTAKAVFMMATVADETGNHEQFIFAVVRGDMEVNETKLANAVRAKSLRPATEAEIRAIGAEPGYGSPVGVHDCLIVVDTAVTISSNLVAGANEAGYHYRNVNHGRDYEAHIITDIVSAYEGAPCPQCQHSLKAVRGVEVGNIFKLGTRYTEALGATFLDKDGQSRPVVMGSYGVGIGRLLACIAEHYRDENGLKWPITVAPYQVHLIVLPGDETAPIAEKLYVDLQAAGVEVFYDDRDERPGVKFKDADLIGIPLRLTISKRSLEQGGAEYKRRDSDERSIVPLDEVIAHVQAEIKALQAVIDTEVKPVPFRA